MGVKVKFFATFRDKAGDSATEVEANTAGELLNKLADKYEELGNSILEENGPEPELKSGVTVMVNGRNISFLSGNDTELEESDNVAIFPPIGGG
ncbi:MAG: ubiquitin-like small modifier protein 1 [Candidatus Acetothermia bacterium]